MKTTLDQIVVEARELFRERGYAGASMQDLAERVGLKKASLYTRFPSKEALVEPVLALTLEETFADLDDDANDWLGSYEAVLKRIAAALTDRARCVGLHLAYGVQADAPDALSAVRKYFAALRDGLAAILKHPLSAKRATTVATDALVRLEGATLWTVIANDPQPMQRALKALIAEARALNASP
ncbi:TetR/AcrR family transcriptional regulator [Rhodanobacter sp. MP1X3]|uniref:TetR/AcrR family transcriptional regulator n=1 Tax=Rhodanobacter sp. MP1X3 TaxID=2723086 RepID=UPI0016120AFE|nr:TetR/AcrR family transcriptional regulator [Rhodanobacter sp. MP1X3]MBB6244031.1 AcrR family transcriptional regulator [Rhodanobacter sp. MP1X3]